MAMRISGNTPVPGVPWKRVPISGSQLSRIISTGDPGFLFPQQPPAPVLPPPSRPINAGGVSTVQVPISAAQVRRLLQGESPATVLAPGLPPMRQPIAPGFQGPQAPELPISGLPRDGKYMYGGPEPVPGFPWRTRETVPLSVQPPPQPALPQPRPPVAPRRPAPMPQTGPESPGMTREIPITAEQAQRLMAGESPSTVLGANILPIVPPGSPLPPAQTPESIGPPNETPTDQLKGLPWESIELTKQELPDFMRHVTTDPNVLALLHNLIPDAPWISDTMRPGPGAEPQTSPIPASVPVFEEGYMYGGTPVPGYPWIS